MILEIDKNIPQPAIIEYASEIINNTDGVFVYPTDTVYGLGCKISNKVGIEKISKLKGCRKNKNYSILFKNLDQLFKFVIVDKKQIKILTKYLPGKFTFILKANKKIPNYLISKEGTVGVRVSNNKVCVSLISALNSPILTTSFNISGKAPISDVSKAQKSLLNKIDLILGVGLLKNLNSTVVDLTKKPYKILRKGGGVFNN